jgi:YggT family protein
MSALIFIVDTLLRLLLLVFLLRVLLQFARADFRNQISQAVVRITNPLVLPLRRILPPVGKVGTASIVAVILVAAAAIAIQSGLRGFLPPNPIAWIQAVVIEIARTTLWTYFYAIFVYALLTMIAPGGYSPLQSLLESLCEPVLRPFRRFIPPIAGIDLSPLWAGIAIQALLILLP